MRRRGLIIFWPQYFDLTRSVSKGRRVPKRLATPNPTVEDVAAAAKSVGYYYELDLHPKYPRTWWDDPGYVLIDTKGQKKNAVLKKLAPLVKKEQKQRIEKAKLEKLRKKHKKKQVDRMVKKKLPSSTKKGKKYKSAVKKK